jgi:hypothetical protein
MNKMVIVDASDVYFTTDIDKAMRCQCEIGGNG